MAWQGIEGHDDVVARFVAAASRGRIAGAFLFIGPDGVGKGLFARTLAKALVCPAPRPGLEPCGNCPSCIQASAGSHPDIDVVEKPEDRATIPLEVFIGDREHRMREGLCWRILLAPALGRRKVAIILDADHLSDEAANCLLKTLEEPPDSSAIILVGTALERQLPTIRSRCQIIRFAPLESGTVATILRRDIASGAIEAAGIDDATIDSCAARSGGSLSRARLLLDPPLAGFRARLLDMLSHRPLHGVDLAREVQQLVEAAGKDAPPRRARLRVVLGAALDFFRASLRSSAGSADAGRDGERQPTADPELQHAVASWGGSAEQATVGIRCTLDALDGIERNAHLPTLVDAWTVHLEPAAPPAPPGKGR